MGIDVNIGMATKKVACGTYRMCIQREDQDSCPNLNRNFITEILSYNLEWWSTKISECLISGIFHLRLSDYS